MRVCGVGLDLLEISRIESKIADNRFTDRVFTPDELAYVQSRGRFSAASAAGIFCAKEAFMKAAGEGMSIPFREIEVCRDTRGKPFLRLHGKTAEHYGICSFEVSITHTDTTAGAVVVLSAAEEAGV